MRHALLTCALLLLAGSASAGPAPSPLRSSPAAAELQRLRLMAERPALIAPAYTGERPSSPVLVAGAPSRTVPSLAAFERREPRAGRRSPSAPPRGKRSGMSLRGKLLLVATAMAFFAVAGVGLGLAVWGVSALVGGAVTGAEAIGGGAYLGAGLGFAIGYPAAFSPYGS